MFRLILFLLGIQVFKNVDCHHIEAFTSALGQFMKSLPCPKGCNLLCQAGQFELSRAKLVEILLNFDKLGTGHSLANTDINFERVKVCIPAIILSDPTANHELIIAAVIRAQKIRANRKMKAKKVQMGYEMSRDYGVNVCYNCYEPGYEPPSTYYSVDMEVDEYDSNNEATYGIDLKESNEVGAMLQKFGKQPEKIECNQEENGKMITDYIYKLEAFVGSMNFKGVSEFDITWKEASYTLADVLMNLKEPRYTKPVNNTEHKICNYYRCQRPGNININIRLQSSKDHYGYNGYNDLMPPTIQNFKRVSKGFLYLLSSQSNQENTALIKSAIYLAATSRQDTAQIPVRLVDLFPEIRAAPTISVTFSDYEDYQDEVTGSWKSLRIPSRASEMESALDYFREDNDLHETHKAWHENNRWGLPNMRERERFFYFHSILLNRYSLERFNEGLPPVQPLSPNLIGSSFSTFYRRTSENDPEAMLVPFLNLGTYREECFLSEQNQSKIRFDYEQQISFKNNPMEGDNSWGKLVEDNYHANLHNSIGKECIPFMLRFQVSARTPIFYRVHTEINKIWTEYNSIRNYNREDVYPPQGLVIRDIQLKSRCAQFNQVETFWRFEGNVVKLDHDDFAFRLRLNNQKGLRGKVIIRIFLGPYNGRQDQFIEMDRFTFELNGDQNVEMWRNDKDSSFIKTENVLCGWPFNLFLPKGGDRRPRKFFLLAFVNGLNDQRVNVGANEYLRNPMCGVNKEVLNGNGQILFDDNEREYGFPFNRQWNFDPRPIFNNIDSNFGNMRSVVQIVHTGRKTPTCNQNYFTNV